MIQIISLNLKIKFENSKYLRKFEEQVQKFELEGIFNPRLSIRTFNEHEISQDPSLNPRHTKFQIESRPILIKFLLRRIKGLDKGNTSFPNLITVSIWPHIIF